MSPAPLAFSSAALARAALGDLERALDHHGWPWRPQLSRWIDALILLIEESAT
jgi:hypothetical protein